MQEIGDYHVHTNLSNCGAREATPQAYLALCAEQGVTDIGFSNHMWDETIPGASPWYQNQTVAHVLSIREQLPADTGGVRVHIGCEIEIDRHMTVALAAEHRELFDYVLIPTSHLHMKGFTIDEDVTELRDVRRILLQRVRAALDCGLASGIAHPFGTLGYFDVEDELLAGFTDREFLSVFGEIAQAGVSVEINEQVIRDNLKKDADGLSVQYQRMYCLARECGCLFHLGSDAHKPEAFRTCHGEMLRFAAACGIHSFCHLETIHAKKFKKQ